MKKALLIINTGSPDSPRVRDVGKFLAGFLNDKRVIDIPFLLRILLVNLIIIPFRVLKSTKKYRKIWTSAGSPLKINMESLTRALRTRLDSEILVIGAMRYGSPSIEEALKDIRKSGAGEIIVFPLYPQYALSTTGSAFEKIRKIAGKWESGPDIRFIESYFSDDAFIDAFASRINSYEPSSYDHLLFSYHSLPVRQIRKVCSEGDVNSCKCETEFPEGRTRCYRAACYETSRRLAASLGLQEGTYSTTFQSRLPGNWLKPFTDEKIPELLQKNKGRLLVASPSFVADCLETILDIDMEYRELFLRSGGEKFDLVRSLNSEPYWSDAITRITGLSGR